MMGILSTSCHVFGFLSLGSQSQNYSKHFNLVFDFEWAELTSFLCTCFLFRDRSIAYMGFIFAHMLHLSHFSMTVQTTPFLIDTNKAKWWISHHMKYCLKKISLYWLAHCWSLFKREVGKINEVQCQWKEEISSGWLFPLTKQFCKAVGDRDISSLAFVITAVLRRPDSPPSPPPPLLQLWQKTGFLFIQMSDSISAVRCRKVTDGN